MSYNKLKFSSLGKNNIIPESPDPKILDKVINPKKNLNIVLGLLVQSSHQFVL